MPDTPVEKDVFGLWLDHGASPQGARYAYAVITGIAADKMAAQSRRSNIAALSNTAALQAVSFAKSRLIQIAFREAGALRLGDGLTVRADKPCLLMLRRAKWGYRLAVAEPTQQEKQLTIALTGHYAARDCRYDEAAGETAVTIKLPTGGRAGATVTRQLRLVAQASLSAQ